MLNFKQRGMQLLLTLITTVGLLLTGIITAPDGSAADGNNRQAASAKMPAADRVSTAKSRMVGHCLKNHATYVKMCIEGSYKYYRKVKIGGDWQKKAFWGAVVYTQRCKKTGCWGKLRTWRLPPRFHYGKKVASSLTTSSARRMDGGYSCPPSLMGIPLCQVPWNWLNSSVDKVQRKVLDYAVEPCLKGAVGGFGGVASANLWTRIFFEDGVISAAKAASIFTGPEGVAIATGAGCTYGVGAKGVKLVENLWN